MLQWALGRNDMQLILVNVLAWPGEADNLSLFRKLFFWGKKVWVLEWNALGYLLFFLPSPPLFFSSPPLLI